jgi:hypothetical protein
MTKRLIQEEIEAIRRHSLLIRRQPRFKDSFTRCASAEHYQERSKEKSIGKASTKVFKEKKITPCEFSYRLFFPRNQSVRLLARGAEKRLKKKRRTV